MVLIPHLYGLPSLKRTVEEINEERNDHGKKPEEKGTSESASDPEEYFIKASTRNALHIQHNRL